MRNAPNGALAFALAALIGAKHRRKTVATRVATSVREPTEREKWNAAVDAKRAAKKARRAATKETSNA